MYWIVKSSKKPKVDEPRSTTKGSLEYPTLVRSRGSAPANAIIEDLTANECRLRSVVYYDIHAKLEFDAELPDRPPATISGHVASRLSAPPRFTYRIALDRVKPHIRPEAPDLHSLQHLPKGNGLTRESPRFPCEFALAYRTVSEGFRSARGANISAGGLLMTSRDALGIGMLLELHFTLPNEVLFAYPERTRVFDLRHPVSGKSVPSKLRRPFKEMLLCGRVVYHEPIGGGFKNYGVKFTGLPHEQQREIARYLEALELVKSRQSS